MARQKLRYVIVGAGFAGLSAAEMLKRAGIDFTVYEKAGEVGGTWRDNTYPGLYVDVPSRQYEFPFQPNYDWSRRFAPGPEIQAYIKKVADDRGLRTFIRFNEEIVSARFTDGRWHIKTAKGTSDVADVFIAATGFLSTPITPAIEGRETFAGPAFHSSDWDHSVPMKGKRWGVIGGGASGVQITEALAYRECEVTQFIRRAQWVWIRENPYTTSAEQKELKLPGVYERVQKELWDGYSVADRWRIKPGPQREAMQSEFKKFLEIVRDPELRRKLTPDYHLGCTRIPKSDQNYYEAVQQPNVHIEVGPIARIVPEGIVMANGNRHDLDVLVYATGYDAHAYMRPIKIFGLNELSIDEAWKDRIYSYRGVVMPGFPNLFMLYGPFAPVNNLSVPIGLLQEMAYIMKIVEIAHQRNAAVMPTVAATEKFLERMRAALPDTVWVGCKNWYSDQTGTPILWPLPQDDHTDMMADIALGDLEFVPVSQAR
ncbi:MAG: flavin-containing monooxygenase [Burkholderiales bacterium]